MHFSYERYLENVIREAFGYEGIHLRLEFRGKGKVHVIGQNRATPGMVGAVGAFLGDQDINISFMKVGREKVRGNALMVMGLDDEISPELLRKLESIPGLHAARLAKL